ncbi:Putative odorant receptor 13a [Atta colombica]|uniref:Putative odorant receptor 13a n=1 Tax=Atta colombica TaxID=520822 RepID=A0A195AXZ8_9HYME|nr:Putative odorant receptor 13a [Atta colombica]
MDINNYVFINRKVLKFVGLYPTNIMRYIICCMCMITIVIPQGLQIYQNWQDLSTVLETSSVLLTILLAILKSLVWISNRRKMDPFIKYMLTDYWNILTTYISEKHTDAILPIIEIVIAVIKGTNNNTIKHFPFLALYPEYYYNFPMYEITYFSQMIATSLCGLIILGTDTLIATALFHTCGHFKVLKKFCDYMETVFSPMLFLQTLASSLIICLVGFQIATANITASTISKSIKYISYLIMALFQLLLFCIPGDALIYEKTVYTITWYELPVSFKTEICLLMLRSQKSSKITAGKFYVMHLENFNAVLSTAASYFMLLRSFGSDETTVKL